MFETIVTEIRLMGRLMLDSRVSLWAKLVPVAALVYVLSPVDLIPDFLIGLGQLDDLGILLGSTRLFRSMIPGYIIDEHLEIINGGVIQAPDYKIKNRDE